MRSKTILATVVAGALGVPLAALADSDSYGSRSPSAGASVSSGTSAQGSLGSNGPSAGSNSQDRGDRTAQNDDHDNGKHRDKDEDRGANAESQNDQYAQSDGDSTLANTPGDPSSSPSGSTGDASMRQATSRS
jgi:hypothetical protein